MKILYRLLIILNLFVISLIFNYCSSDEVIINDENKAPTPPQLISPISESSNLIIPITFLFDSNLGAQSYGLQMSTDREFTSIVFNNNNLTITSLEIFQLYYFS